MSPSIQTIIMKRNSFAILLLCALCACSSPSKDMTYPEILPVGETTSPQNCQEFRCGGVLPVSYAFSDNMALGSYNLEVHNNFNHHTHSTEAGECKQDPIKDPVNPWVYNQDFTITPGSTYFEASHMIPIPEDIDPGEYHFMIRLVDASGWQQLRSVSIRINPAED